MESGRVGFGEAAFEAGLDRAAVAVLRQPALDDARSLRQADGLEELDRRLVTVCGQRGPLRAVLARIAFRLVSSRVWERIGYARLSDYAAELLGLSARSVQSLAQVGGRLEAVPALERALVSGTLGWTKVRLLAQLPREEDAVAWIDYARGVTAQQLSKVVRAVDRGSVESGAVGDASRSRRFEVRCTPEVRRNWVAARVAAGRAAGRMVHVSEAAELIAAEVLSALPIDEPADDASSRAELEERASDSSTDTHAGAGSPEGGGATALELRPPWRETTSELRPADAERPALPPALAALVEGLRDADAFGLDERFRRAQSMEQRLDACIGSLVSLVWQSWLYGALGYASRDAYVRERLGMDATRARALVRLERAAAQNESFARAYRTGALSWVKADVLVPLVASDSLGQYSGPWVDWARRVTVRRLREDVEQALALREADAHAFRRSAGLPPEARLANEGSVEGRRSGLDDREIGAHLTTPAAGSGGVDREIGARSTTWEGDSPSGAREACAPDGRAVDAGQEISAPWSGAGDYPAAPGGGGASCVPWETCSVQFIGPADVVKLFRAALCTVRRRMERDLGRLPTPGEALGAMLEHAFESWGFGDGKVAARHRVFARDGWRCSVPGCTSMQNLHDHHIHFRSLGGSDALHNRTTLCAFHHLRGVHAGVLRCTGRAPDGLRWEIGIRPGITPLLAYRSGDLRVSPPPAHA